MTGSAVRVDGTQGITPIWPVATAVNAEGALTFHGRTAESLLDEFGSPLYLIDTDEVSARARYFVRAAADAFTNSTTHVSFAGKAFLSKEVVRLVTDAGMLVDTCSMGEMRIALAAGVPAVVWCCTATTSPTRKSNSPSSRALRKSSWTSRMSRPASPPSRDDSASVPA